MTSAVQTIWCDLLVGTLVDAGVSLVVISPGSRSTPLVTSLSTLAPASMSLVTIIDERAAAFYALGAARATNRPVALVCTSGTAGAHYLPALIEAHLSQIPLVAITADRPPELLDCGASQTIDQVHLYGRFVRTAIDLGAPTGTPIALRALRRKITQAITLARGPLPGPIHLEVPLRKPLEPIAPSTDEDRALAQLAHSLRGPLHIAPPSLAPDAVSLTELATAIAAEPDGIIVVGAMPASFASARDTLLALAERAGYPVFAESGSQLRFAPPTHAVDDLAARTRGPTRIDRLDLIPIAQRPTPRLVIQLGAEPVASSWPHWDLSRAQRWVLAPTWADPTSTACVILGEVALSLDALIALIADRSAPNASFAASALDPRAANEPHASSSEVAPSRASQQRIRTSAWLDTWRELDARATRAIDHALDDHPRSEGAAIRAALDALPPGVVIQIGNSLPIRVIDQVARSMNRVVARATPANDLVSLVLTQRGAAGIDGLIASAAGATHAGPVLLVLGDVSFAHDVGGLLAARAAKAPLAILVVDNRGGQIFAGLPVAKAGIAPHVVDEHWLTAPGIDPAAVASAMGLRAHTAASPAAIASAITDALAQPGVTVIHAPVSASGAHDVRRAAMERMDHHDQPQPTRTARSEGHSHVDEPRRL